MGSPLFNSIGAASFGSPASADPTSAPAMPQLPQPSEIQGQSIPNPLQKMLAAKSKPKKIKVNPVLTAAIARARRAKPSAEKFG